MLAYPSIPGPVNPHTNLHQPLFPIHESEHRNNNYQLLPTPREISQRTFTMHTTRLFLSLFLTILTPTVTALPLNINLGAYSPAMVVGDGAISFEDVKEEGAEAGVGEGAKAENLIQTLQ